MSNKPDIADRRDIEQLIAHFYDLILKSEIAYIFHDATNIDWEKHLPVMHDFWSTLLLDETSYKGNAMLKHLELDLKTRLKPETFAIWLSSFKASVDALFEGPVADEAKSRASQIAGLMEYKVGLQHGQGHQSFL